MENPENTADITNGNTVKARGVDRDIDKDVGKGITKTQVRAEARMSIWTRI